MHTGQRIISPRGDTPHGRNRARWDHKLSNPDSVALKPDDDEARDFRIGLLKAGTETATALYRELFTFGLSTTELRLARIEIWKGKQRGWKAERLAADHYGDGQLYPLVELRSLPVLREKDGEQLVIDRYGVRVWFTPETCFTRVEIRLHQRWKEIESYTAS